MQLTNGRVSVETLSRVASFQWSPIPEGEREDDGILKRNWRHLCVVVVSPEDLKL